MNSHDVNEYIKLVGGFSFDANKYFNDSEPWALKKNDILRMNTILYTISEQIRNISILLSPIIPESTEKILNIINEPIPHRPFKINNKFFSCCSIL